MPATRGLVGRVVGGSSRPILRQRVLVPAAARRRCSPTTACRRALTSQVAPSASAGASSWLAAVSAHSPAHTAAAVNAPRSDQSIKERAATDVGAELQRRNAAALEAVHPWFVANMSPAYFQTVAPATQTKHIESLAYMYSMSREPDISYQEDGELTVIMPGEGTGLSREWAGGNPQILSMLQNIPEDKTLQSINKYTSMDGSITIVNVTFDEPELYSGSSDQELTVRDNVLAFADAVRSGSSDWAPACGASGPAFEHEAINTFLAKCSSDYVTRNRDPSRLLDQMLMYNAVAGSDDTQVNVEEASVVGSDGPRWLLTIASGNSQPRLHLGKIANYLGVHGISVRRLYLDLIADEDADHPVMMLRVLVGRPAAPDAVEAGSTGEQQQQLDMSEITEQLMHDIKKLKWIDDKVINLADRHEHISFGEAEIITALASLVHGPLSKKNRHAFTRTGLFDLLEKPENLAVADQIASLFLAKFDPNNPLTGDALTDAAAKIQSTIDVAVAPGSIEGQALLEAMLDGVMKTIRTNYFVGSRYALGLRLDPSFMGVNEVVGDDVPYGTFFITGRGFVAFHVRNRDISRGGLRVVQPPTLEAHGVASAGAYDEAYALAYAQQLKNKDIPEGGSKAVCVVEPYGDPAIDHHLQRKSIKAFSDTLLDFMSEKPEVSEQISGAHAGGLQDIVYLGPDENVIPADINWMTDRAIARGYKYASAFISSKPGAGFNHKEFGVTSEGVNTFLKVALQEQGVDPFNESFTVKLTGGTNGDVAGNMLKFLHRDYNGNAKVVGIADGTATAEDPDGLCMEELMRMVVADEPIAGYDPAKLGPRGAFMEATTPEGCQMRDTMAFRVKSDVFVPAGGRPATVNMLNYASFLDADGVPSSPLVVEGANLFTTPAARQALFDEAGVIFVKDSSANKCGVITSSYEILLSMMLDTPEFLAMKDDFVPEILTKLRSVAETEARLIFREMRLDQMKPFPVISAEVSAAITRLHDALDQHIGRLSDDEMAEFQHVMREHLPGDAAKTRLDRVEERVPRQYQNAMVACLLASRMVYKEGVRFIESLPDEGLAELALKYMEAETKVGEELLPALEACDMPAELREQARLVLEQAGARMALTAQG